MASGYQVSQLTTMSGTGGGPRTIYNDGSTNYMIIGAFDNVNYINSGARKLVIQLEAGMQITGLTTAPGGTPTSDLVVDAAGNVYRQS